MPFELNHPPGATRRPGPRELTALLAGLMALNAFAIDAMIPALPEIGHALDVPRENDRQLLETFQRAGRQRPKPPPEWWRRRVGGTAL